MANGYKTREQKKAEREKALENYIPVHERIQKFYDEYPQGSIQTEIIAIDENEVMIRALVYRYPDDIRPCIGHAHETKEGFINENSMLENAETSAWGRALAARGLEINRGIASQEEIINAKRRAEGAAPLAEVEKTAEEQERQLAVFKSISELHEKLGATDTEAKKKLLMQSGLAESFNGMDTDTLEKYRDFLKGVADGKENSEQEQVQPEEPAS